jgi:hypothetical protein
MEEYVIAAVGVLFSIIALLVGGGGKLFFNRLAKFEDTIEKSQRELYGELREFRESLTSVRMQYVPNTTCAELRQDGRCRTAMLKALVDNNHHLSGFAQKYEEFSERMQTQGENKIQNTQELSQQIKRLLDVLPADIDTDIEKSTKTS